MKLANLGGRAAVVPDGGIADVAKSSGGPYGFSGDVIFTGTPAGVGFTRQQRLTLPRGTWVDGVGTMKIRFV